MMKQDENSFYYYDTLKEPEGDGYTVIKVWNPLQFYILPGRRSAITLDNLSPIPDLKYLVGGTNGRFYVRDFRDISVRDLRFYYSDRLSPVDESVEILRTYIYDGRVWLLLTAEQMENIRAVLARVYKANLQGEGTLKYKAFIEILDQTLQLEDYKSYAGNLVGFQTVCKQFTDRIAELFKGEYERNNKKES